MYNRKQHTPTHHETSFSASFSVLPANMAGFPASFFFHLLNTFFVLFSEALAFIQSCQGLRLRLFLSLSRFDPPTCLIDGIPRTGGFSALRPLDDGAALKVVHQPIVVRLNVEPRHSAHARMNSNGTPLIAPGRISSMWVREYSQ